GSGTVPFIRGVFAACLGRGRGTGLATGLALALRRGALGKAGRRFDSCFPCACSYPSSCSCRGTSFQRSVTRTNSSKCNFWPRSSSRCFRARVPISLICAPLRSEEHTSELQSRENLVCRLLLEKNKPRGRR